MTPATERVPLVRPTSPAPMKRCPGGCGRDVRKPMLLCARCWYGLEKSTRFRVSRCWQLFRKRAMSRADYLDVAAIAIKEARRRFAPAQTELGL